MVLHCCNCLNVRIDLGSGSTSLSDVSKSLLNDDEKSDNFFKKPEAMLLRTPASDPVILHPWLLTNKVVGRWGVYHCLNCRTDVYASSLLDGQKALVTGCVGIRDLSRIQALERSGLFSPAFKIVLVAEDFHGSKAVPPPIDPESSGIYEQATKYLEMEEKAMLTRIQKYNDEQQAQYLKMQSRVLQERSMLLSLLMAKREMSSTSPSRREPAPQSPEVAVRKTPAARETSSFSSAFSRNVFNNIGKAPTSRPKDALFDLDGLDLGEGVESAVEATEDILPSGRDDVDTDLHEEGMAIPSNMPVGSIAKSLPMVVPPALGASRIVDIDLDATPQETADIPLSMRAISQSIQGDVMWERPRPRLNTMN